MKNWYNAFILVIFISSGIFANSNSTSQNPDLKIQAREWYKKQKQFGFRENKGQMLGNDNKPVPYVLFKAETPGLNIWVTTGGLTYQFLKNEGEQQRKANPTIINPNNQIHEEHEEGREQGSWYSVNMLLKDATIKKENIIAESGLSGGTVNYYLAHCTDGIFDVKTYSKITFQNVYQGIDWVLYISINGGIKHDFIVHPDATPDQIRLIYEGAGEFHLENNRIYFKNEYGELNEGELICYQGSENNTIASNYSVQESGRKIKNGFSYEVSVKPEKYNKHEILVIDPQLVWGTFYGGNADDGFNSIDCDNAGNVYVASYSTSTNFPTQTLAGAYFSATSSGGWDALLLKFSNTGVLIWATYYGGTGGEAFWSINVLSNGDFFVSGMSDSPDFPTQAWGGAYFDNTNSGGRDAVVLKFSNVGVRIWATYYGGSGWDEGFCITTDPIGNIYVTGTARENFPTQTWAGAFNDNLYGGTTTINTGDAFILRFSNTGILDWATYYGGSGGDRGCSINCDTNGNIYVTGDAQSGFPTQAGVGAFSTAYYDGNIGGTQDAFVLRFSNTGVLDWATFLGGPQSDFGHTTITTSTNEIYVLGSTDGGFPVQPGTGSFTGAYYDGTYGGGTDAFIVRFSNSGLLNWSTYYGGTALEFFSGNSFDDLEIDGCDNLYVTFATTSTNIQTLSPACGSFFDGTYNGTGGWRPDGFIIKFNYTGILLWASYISINNHNYRGALTVDSNNNLFVGGESSTGMTGFLLNPMGGSYFDNTHNGGTDDAFIAKFIPSTPAKSQSQVNSTSCVPCNGSATINVTCGEPNYSYAWSNGSSTQNSTGTTNTITGLCPGTYTVSVTSNCNKTQTAVFIITGTSCSGITATATSAATCQGSTPCPVIAASGSGGTSPYTYLWNTGASTQNINPCPAATTIYTVTITDTGGATAITTAIVTVNPFVAITTTVTNITCNNGTDGSVSASIGSGTSPYTYSWSAPGGSGPLVSGLSAGNYTITVTDGKGCTATAVASILSPPPLSGLFAKGTAVCAGCGCKEWIMVTSSGGTSPYSYTWTDGYVNRYKNQLCPGAYSINIKDKNGCSVNVNLTAP